MEMSAPDLICLAIVLMACAEEFLLLILFKPFTVTAANKLPRVTVMVAMRNEEANIDRCLQGLLNQNYAGEYEILVGDDRSEDRTWEILSGYDDPRLKPVQVKQNLGNARGKANVIAHLAEHASGDLWLITDADCRVNPDWVESMAVDWPVTTGAVNGLTQVRGNSFQHLEWLRAQGMLHVINGRWNITGIGNNMAARREAYFTTGGYENLPFSLTEDRALVVAMDQHGYNVQSRVCRGTLAETRAVQGWKEIISQRRRWMTGAVRAPSGIVILLVIQAMYYPAILGVLLYSWKWGIFLFISKAVMQAGFAAKLQKLCTIRVPWYTWAFNELYAGIMAWLHITIHLIPGGVSWKGRKFTVRA